MKIRKKWAGHAGAVAKTALGLALAVIMVGTSVTPVLARDDNRYHGRDRHYRHVRPYRPGPGYYQPPGYYAPPPPAVAYTPPPPPPGITFVFPLHFR